MLDQFEPMIKLSEAEDKKFAAFIRTMRKVHIKSPKETAALAMEANKAQIQSLLNDGKISEAIVELRQMSYDEFLKEESIFNGVVLSEIGKKFDTPKAILDGASQFLFDQNFTSPLEFSEKLSELFGVYAGHISPYIYQLCLSNTQSRRSRAGKVFEGIIYFLYEKFDFEYESQASIGKKVFSALKLGKVVDSILPSCEAFTKNRIRTIVGSMKTTLRERWQEVVEEIQRSGLPNIFLLTVDDDISESKAEQMSQHNIILVVLNHVKLKPKLVSRHNIIDFETYFNREIPERLNYWKQETHD